jgi:hypothetical protein
MNGKVSFWDFPFIVFHLDKNNGNPWTVYVVS